MSWHRSGIPVAGFTARQEVDNAVSEARIAKANLDRVLALLRYTDSCATARRKSPS